MRPIKKVIVHCSDSPFGDAAEIDRWHKKRGWDGIGYQYVILNGKRHSKGPFNKADDGLVEVGRPIEEQGAHCKGRNHDSIGVCLIGCETFTPRQLYKALPELSRKLMREHKVPVENVFGHYEFNDGKTCPNIDMALVRRLLNYAL